MTTLRILRSAYNKAEYLCKKASTEVSGRFLTKPEDPYLVVDVVLVPLDEAPTVASISEDVIKTAMLCADIEDNRGLQSWIWWHTHPGNSANPSGTDWVHSRARMTLMPISGMAILARGGDQSFHVLVRDPWGVVLEMNCGKWEIIDEVINTKELDDSMAEILEPWKKAAPTTVFNYQSSNLYQHKTQPPYTQSSWYDYEDVEDMPSPIVDPSNTTEMVTYRNNIWIDGYDDDLVDINPEELDEVRAFCTETGEMIALDFINLSETDYKKVVHFLKPIRTKPTGIVQHEANKTFIAAAMETWKEAKEAQDARLF